MPRRNLFLSEQEKRSAGNVLSIKYNQSAQERSINRIIPRFPRKCKCFTSGALRILGIIGESRPRST